MAKRAFSTIRLSSWVLATGSLFVLIGCGASSAARTQQSNCKKNPAVTSGGKSPTGKASLTTGAASSLNLASSLATVTGDPGVGSGYLDIETTSTQAGAQRRRCTMHLRPIDSSDTVVRVWTA